MRLHDSRYPGMAAVLCACVATAGAAEFSVVPVSATGTHFIKGNELTVLSRRARIVLDMWLSGWDPSQNGDIPVFVWQLTLDGSAWHSGVLGELTWASDACEDTADCEAAFGPGALCDDETIALPPNTCTPGYQDTTREDWVYRCCTDAIAAVAHAQSRNVAFGAITITSPGAIDDGTPKYVGTLILDAGATARGTFTVGALPGFAGTFINGVGTVPVDAVHPAIIHINPPDACCIDGGPCRDLPPEICEMTFGGRPVVGTRCRGPGDTSVDLACESDCNANGLWDKAEISSLGVPDCNMNQVPDECEKPLVPGDFDGDRIVGPADVGGFALCITGPCGDDPCVDDACCLLGDVDGDGDIDLRDYGSSGISAP